MKRKFPFSFLLLFLIFLLFSPVILTGQEQHVLTYNEAINIALKRSYTVKSFNLQKESYEQYYNYRKAGFKPKIDFNLSVPAWNENVVPIERADGLPVYNSTGTFSTGGNLEFQYILPTGGFLSLKGAMTRTNLKTVLALSGYDELSERNAQTSITLGFQQPIFTRNTLDENLKQAQYQYERFLNQYTRTEMDIIYNVTNNFYELYRAIREVEIEKEQVKNSEEALRIAKLKAETGKIPEGDVLTQEITVANNRTDLFRKEGNLESSRDAFKQLIGLPLEDEISIVTDLKYETFDIDESKAISEALKNRLELDEKELDIKLQKIEVDKAKREREFSGNISAYYDLTGVSTLGYGATSELIESSWDNFKDRPPNRGVTLSFSYPLFDWGRGSARVGQQKASLKNDQLELDNLKINITREVKDLVRRVAESRNRLQIQERNQENAQRSYRISQLRFENGDMTSQELGREEERLAESQLQYLNAFIDYQLAIADLKRKTMWDFKNNRSYLKESYFQEQDTSKDEDSR